MRCPRRQKLRVRILPAALGYRKVILGNFEAVFEEENFEESGAEESGAEEMGTE